MTRSAKPSDPPRQKLVLASQSERRRQLLRQIGFEPVCLPVGVIETPLENEAPADLVSRLAVVKAKACVDSPEYLKLEAANDDIIIVAADTVIDLDGQILGKPLNEQDAVAMLQSLSGREHKVLTGVCVLQGRSGRVHEQLVSTTVRFAEVSAKHAHQYWLSEEPHDKAGGYAIQGLGAQFVAHICGSYSNVVGLPLFETSSLLSQAGLASL